jgi:hypothetical protein
MIGILSLITFDWAQIGYIGSPLATPWWAEANIMAGFVFFFCTFAFFKFYFFRNVEGSRVYRVPHASALRE